jgi:tRNA(Ile2) C34 agmatinyltransferase TiaS
MFGIEGFALAVFVFFVIGVSVWGYLHRGLRCPECGEKMVQGKNKTWVCESCGDSSH